MKVFLLEVIDNRVFEDDYDVVTASVIVAETEKDARKLLFSETGWEEECKRNNLTIKNPWLNSDLTSCEEVDLTISEVVLIQTTDG